VKLALSPPFARHDGNDKLAMQRCSRAPFHRSSRLEFYSLQSSAEASWNVGSHSGRPQSLTIVCRG
jgi:hypothetical protein